MPSTERCPICQVAVKPENLLRHLNDIHPRHPDTPAVRERLKEEGRGVAPRHTAAPIRIRRWHAGVALGVAGVLVAIVLLGPFFAPNYTRDSCIGETYHAHSSLRIWAVDHYHPIPGNIGISSSCHRPIHTHSGYDPSTGYVTLHLGGPFPKDFTLGDFFYIWDQPFSETQVVTFIADGTYRITMRVDGNPSTAYAALVLRDGQQTEIIYDS